MQDQATKLRRLVSRIAAVEERHSRAQQIVLTGAKGGVGTTTLAINLAISLRKHASRVLLIDANPVRGDVATICGLNRPTSTPTVNYDLENVLQSKCDWLQATVTGPAGIQVVPRFGVNALATASGYGQAYPSGYQFGRQLTRRLDAINHSFDFVVVDGGSCPMSAEPLWSSADEAIVVTTTDQVAITNTYTLLKSLRRTQVVTEARCVINRYVDHALATDVGERLTDSCQRFLQVSLQAKTHIPADQQIAVAQANERMVTCAAPESPASLAIGRIAKELASIHIAQPTFNSAVTA